MRILFTCLLIFLLSLPLAAGSIKAPKGFSGKLWAGTFELYMIDKEGAFPTCTVQAYEKIVGGYHLFSAGHCVQENPEQVSFAVAEDTHGKLMPVTMLKAYDGDSLDFSIFEFKTTKRYPVLSFGNEEAAHVGDPIVVVNFGDSLGKQLSYGTISSSGLPAAQRCDGTCAGAFLIQIFAAPGSSGAAVILKKNQKVIGVVMGQWDENVGIGVMPISRFVKFLAGPSQPHPAPVPESAAPITIIIQR